MQRVAPVNLPFNVKTLWFDPEDIDVHVGNKVVVQTARGLELGVVASDVIEVDEEEISKLKSPLRPIERIATEEDEIQALEMERKSREAMPIFKRLARETNEEMHPVTVEYMLDGDKAIFYFESEERVDFRDLVRKLASEFHVRIDMRQIGVRDEARIVGGIAHCGQLVCCKRLGGEFKPVSIRMAKDQDLSLNPQKISGLCGRLMCCLRYENMAYKDFKSKAPKMDARVETPDGEGKVVEYDVPRETISVKVGDEKPIKVALSAFTLTSDDRKNAKVDPDEWNKAVEQAALAIYETVDLLQLPKFTGNDKLGSAKAVHNPTLEKEKGKRRGDSHRRSRNRSHSPGESKDAVETESKRTSRRRSTKIKADGSQKETTISADRQKGDNKGSNKQKTGNQGRGKGASGAKRKQSSGQGSGPGKLRPGHKSSGLAHDDSKKAAPDEKSGTKRRRRRRRKSSGQGTSAGSGATGTKGSGASQASSDSNNAPEAN